MTEVLTQDTFKAGLISEGTTTVPTPSNGTDAASKAYVDTRTPQVTVSSTAPSTPAVGSVWVDTT